MIWIVAHDAGGAEVLSSWIAREQKPSDVVCVLEGPAVDVFQRKISSAFKNVSFAEFKNLVRNGDQVITGSGVTSDLELNAIQFAKKNKIPVATWIDHWINYPQRFSRHGELTLPDEIWVTDIHQQKKVQEEIGAVPTVMKNNPYFDEIKDQLKTFPPRKTGEEGQYRWLFIGEAWSEIRPDQMKLPAKERSEMKSLQLFLKMITESSPSNPIVRIRPHPAESREKYVEVLKDTQVDWDWSPASTLLEDCIWADEVAGMSSMGLVVAIISGKPSTSIRPDPDWICTIPLPELRKI